MACVVTNLAHTSWDNSVMGGALIPGPFSQVLRTRKLSELKRDTDRNVKESGGKSGTTWLWGTAQPCLKANNKNGVTYASLFQN